MVYYPFISLKQDKRQIGRFETIDNVQIEFYRGERTRVFQQQLYAHKLNTFIFLDPLFLTKFENDLFV